MKCQCNNHDNGISKDAQEMNKTGPDYYLKDNHYQKYVCPKCERTKVKVLDGYSKGGRIKV